MEILNDFKDMLNQYEGGGNLMMKIRLEKMVPTKF